MLYSAGAVPTEVTHFVNVASGLELTLLLSASATFPGSAEVRIATPATINRATTIFQLFDSPESCDCLARFLREILHFPPLL